MEHVYNAVRRRWAVLVYVAAMMAVAVLVGVSPSRHEQFASGQPERMPKLIVEESVASDFQALAEETWARFLTVFQVRAGCFGDVHLRAATTLDSRAAYDPDTATVTVRIPGTRAMLQQALIHEWAHHIEFRCRAQRELRPAFLKAQGLPPDTPWRPALPPAEVPTSMWADVPSEQYAEATVELVLGERPIPTVARVRPESVRVVEVWAAGH